MRIPYDNGDGWWKFRREININDVMLTGACAPGTYRRLRRNEFVIAGDPSEHDYLSGSNFVTIAQVGDNIEWFNGVIDGGLGRICVGPTPKGNPVGGESYQFLEGWSHELYVHNTYHGVETKGWGTEGLGEPIDDRLTGEYSGWGFGVDSYGSPYTVGRSHDGVGDTDFNEPFFPTNWFNGSGSVDDE